MAFEAAQQFQRQGGKVEFVILFDSWVKQPNIWHKLRQFWKQTPNGQSTVRYSLLVGYRLMRSRWSFLKRAANRIWLFFNPPRPSEFTTLVDEQSWFVEWELLERLYAKLIKSYRPRRIVGRGILIRADPIDDIGAARAFDDSLGWKNLFTGGVEIIPVIGDHRSILREHNPTLARKLSDVLKCERGQVPIVGGNHQFAFLTRQRSSDMLLPRSAVEANRTMGPDVGLDEFVS